MKSQKHNTGELESLEIKIEKQLISDLKTMSGNSNLTIDELVCIAVKRFRSSHADYMGIDLDYP